jgi:xylitol oxidase
MSTLGTNWAGNYVYQAKRLHEPESIDELRSIVSRAERIRALVTRHSFNDIGDSAELVSLSKLPEEIQIDPELRTVTVSAAMRYGDLAQELERSGYALHNMASLPHISVGGAIATATHGSGVGSGNLATAVVGLELITSDGERLLVGRSDPEFPGMVVHLGALGVVTTVTLAIEPSYRMHQQVFDRLDWDVALDRFDEIMSSATSVSYFTDYGEYVNQVWLKQRVDDDGNPPPRDSLHGASLAAAPRHPIDNQPGQSCTEQLGVAGPWLGRLPHFRMEFTPSNGDEIQSEYILPRQHAAAAIGAVRGLADRIRPVLYTSEIRTIAADDLWLSNAYGTDCIGIHFTWKLEPEAVNGVLPEIEAALAPYSPRPHWGKLFHLTASDLAPRYERMPDFRRLVDQLDPRRTFRNDFLERHVLS